MSCASCFPSGLAFVPLPVSCSSVIDQMQPRPRGIGFFVNVRSTQDSVGNASVVCPILGRMRGGCPSQYCVARTVSTPCSACRQLVSSTSMRLSRLCSCAPSVGSLLTVAGKIVMMKNKRRRGCRVVGRGRLHPVVGMCPSGRSVFQGLRFVIRRGRRVPVLSTRDVRCMEGRRSCMGITRRCTSF